MITEMITIPTKGSKDDEEVECRKKRKKKCRIHQRLMITLQGDSHPEVDKQKRNTLMIQTMGLKTKETMPLTYRYLTKIQLMERLFLRQQVTLEWRALLLQLLQWLVGIQKLQMHQVYLVRLFLEPLPKVPSMHQQISQDQIMLLW